MDDASDAAPAPAPAPEPAPPPEPAAPPDYQQFLGDPSPDQCAGESYDFGLNIFSDTESFALLTVEGIHAVADTMGCVTVEVVSDNADPLTAVENVRIFAERDKDGVIVANVIEAAQAGIVDVLQSNDVPGLAIFVPAPDIALIEVDLGNAGLKSGQTLGEQALARWSGEEIILVVGTFDEAGATTIALTDGIVEGVTAAVPDAEVLAIATAADTPTANANTAAVTARIPEDAKVLIASVNDELTLAMLEALRTAGRSDEDMVAVGQGASQFEAMCDGTLFASVAYFPENYGKYAIPALIGLIHGAELPDVIELPTEVLTAENLGEFYPESACDTSVYEFGTYAVGPDIEAILPEELVAETTEVGICQAPSFNGLTAQIAVEKGFLADRGVTGEFIQCPSGPANAAALIAGEVHFAINTPDNMLGIRNAGFDVVLFQQIQDKHFFDIIISENFGPIDCDQGDWQCTMGALEGTSVGVVARGAAAEQIARQLYDSAGLDPDGATYIATGLSGTTLAALSSGEVDWAITFEPGLSQATIDGIGYSPFALRSGQGPAELDWPSAVNTTSREFFEDNPNTVAIYARSVRQAMDWIRNPANHDELLDIMGSFLGLDRSVAEVVLANNIGSVSLNGRPDPRRLANNVNYAVGRGILEEAQDFSEYAVTP